MARRAGDTPVPAVIAGDIVPEIGIDVRGVADGRLGCPVTFGTIFEGDGLPRFIAQVMRVPRASQTSPV